MTTRAKFYCSSVRGSKELRDDGGKECIDLHVTMEAVTADGGENNDFSMWTPSGHLEFSLTNPALKDTFVESQSYYIAISKA